MTPEKIFYGLIKFDALVKILYCILFVIPAQAGIQVFQIFAKALDNGLHRCDDCS